MKFTQRRRRNLQEVRAGFPGPLVQALPLPVFPTHHVQLFLCGLLPQCPHPDPSQCGAISALNMVFSCPCCPVPSSLQYCTRVLAAELDVGVTDVGHSLAALLVTGVHAVSVPVTAPPQGDAQPIQPALELITVAATRRSCSCRGTGRALGGAGASGQPSPPLPSQSPWCSAQPEAMSRERDEAPSEC